MKTNKTLTRRSFLIGCGLLTLTTAGITLTGCGGETQTIEYPPKFTGAKTPLEIAEVEPVVTPVVEPVKPLGIAKADIILSQDEFDALTAKQYLNYSAKQSLLLYVDGDFYSMSNLCPHERGLLVAKSSNTIECQKHLGQTFDKKGTSNGYEIRSSLRLTRVTVQAREILCAF